MTMREISILCGLYGDVMAVHKQKKAVHRGFVAKTAALVQFSAPMGATLAQRFLHGLSLFGHVLVARHTGMQEVPPSDSTMGTEA